MTFKNNNVDIMKITSTGLDMKGKKLENVEGGVAGSTKMI